MNRRRGNAWLAMVLCSLTAVVGAQETFLGRSLDAWSDAITSADQQKRSQAAWAIAQLAGKAEQGPGEQVYFAELVKLASDGDATVRYWGVVGLGAYGRRGGVKDGGQTAVVNTLMPLLEDKSAAPRIAAAEVLGLFGRIDKALPILEAAMGDPQESVRIQAVAALEKLGTAARPAQATLLKATSETSEYVKRISQRALDRMGAEQEVIAMRCHTAGVFALLVLSNWQLRADEVAPLTVKSLAAKVRPSIVVITFAGREGSQQGLGTGFVIDKRGLIATNLHVIGEARPISVQTAEGKTLSVKAVHASDRALDLAVLQVESGDLVPLELSDEAPAAGESVVVMGNPQGLKHSVVSGVISGTREIDGRTMLQLAVPVEPGNSGGPVLDMRGRVLGIVTMKSAVTENLGFAVAVSDLKTLRDRPNPVPMERWLTIGAIDRTHWEPMFGARWQQRSGRILVDGLGEGFGGRSLLLAKDEELKLPFELAVSVKLDNEAGAAGLVFHSDGKHRHYGFYPSNGKLRLSRFEGPDVFSWQVLAEQPSEHYRAGEWNRLKVRIEDDRLKCFVNDHLVIESNDVAFRRGRVGLAKFRNTGAEFRLFAHGKELASGRPSEADLAVFREKIEGLPPLAEVSEAAVRSLADSRADDARAAILARAEELQARAAELKRLAADVRLASVIAELERLAGPQVENIDLLRGALTIARLDEEDLDVEAYVKHVERMADEVKRKLAAGATESQKLAALNEYLFKDNGFHGSRTDYYHRANSYLSRVIDDREGLPITLSLLYIELGSRLGLKIEGVGLPAHFVVRHVPAEGQPHLIDVFESAAPLSREAAEKKILAMTGEPAQPDHFRRVSNRQILQRILMNLIGNAQNPKTGPDREALIRYESAMLVLDPTSVRDRGLRAVCRWETGRTAGAVADLQVVIDAAPAGLDMAELRRMREYFRTTKPPSR